MRGYYIGLYRSILDSGLSFLALCRCNGIENGTCYITSDVCKGLLHGPKGLGG